MSDGFNTGAAIGGTVGIAVGGLPGALVGGAIGGVLGDAYSRKPSVGSFATTVQNDLAPENVTLDAHQIYVRITTGHGRDSLVDAGSAASALADNFTTRADQIARALSKAGEAWQGDASGAAATATTPLSESFASAQAQLAANSQALNAEVAAFDHIRSQVEPVPETPPQSGVANAVNPFQTDVDAAINEYNAKATKNVQLYEGYSADTAAARSQVAQSYAAPTPLGSASATATTRTGSPIGAAPAAPPQAGSAADAGQPAATNASAAPGATSAPPSTGGASGTPAGTGGQGTDAAARQAPSTTVPNATTPGGMPAMPAPRDTYAGGPLAGPPRPSGTSDLQHKPTGAGPGVGGAGGAGVRGTGSGTGPGVRGGPSVGNGPVPGQIPPGQAQPAGRGGTGGPAVRGSAGAAGMGGAPMGAAGRGNGEEDQEHRRKYLIQPDAEELFGTDEPYVRPVIGDHR